MARCTTLVVLLAPFLIAADCTGSTCPPAAEPMTAARAKEIDPAIETGLAVSTTHIFGDCRPMDPIPTGTCDTGRCARERQALRVLVVPVNVSIPIAAECDPGLGIADTSSAAVADAYASDQGELVLPLEVGRYTVYVSADDRCAVCGLADAPGACTVDITLDLVTVRDLVLDRSTH